MSTCDKHSPASSCPSQRGRPVDPRKDEQILCAAGRLFMAQGLKGTSMEQIAREANVSKLTLYRRYPDKASLFTDIIAERCQHYVPEDLFEANGSSAEEALTRFGIAFLSLITNRDSTNLGRVLAEESSHNSELCKLFFSHGPARIKKGLANLMEELASTQRLACDHPAEAAEMFTALITGSDLCKQCSLNLQGEPNPDDVHSYVTRAVRFFLKAYR